MPAISREPTGLPRTPGNPGKPWRNDRQRKVDDRREGGTGGWRTVTKRGNEQHTQKEMDIDKTHTGRERELKSEALVAQLHVVIA